MPKSIHTSLARREREIMDAVFALGNSTSADQVRTRLIDPPGDSAVRMMLTRLEKKGASNTKMTVPVIFIQPALRSA